MPELRPPLSPTTAATLRQAVLRLRAQESGCAFAPVLHVGCPAGRHASYAEDAGLDQAIRADVVAALLEDATGSWVGGGAGAGPLVWLTRAGDLTVQDVDAFWLAASRQAFAEAGHCLTMVVVTRQGWWDPRSGAQQVWKRLRVR